MKMTRAYLLIIIVLLVGIPISAQIRGNHVNVWVVPDHQDWNYEVGQTAQFKVSVVRSSTLVDDAIVDYEAGPEMYPEVKKKGVKLKNGTMTWRERWQSLASIG